MAGKTKQSEPKMRLDLRAKMYIVLVICSLMLLASVGVAFFLVGGFGSSEDAASDSAVEPESIITESGYNKEENTIDTTAYSATILPESSDAGQTYVDETLFLGDSNTARMYRMFDFCTYDNAIGSVGMSAKSLATYACVELNNSGSYVTMAKAVAGMQPKRVIITFGTNDLSPSYKAADFVKNYQTGIESIVEAYPSVDILINAIPPLGQQHSNQSLTQTQVDEYNKALVEMCQEKGWKFLNSAEVLKLSLIHIFPPTTHWTPCAFCICPVPLKTASWPCCTAAMPKRAASRRWRKFTGSAACPPPIRRCCAPCGCGCWPACKENFPCQKRRTCPSGWRPSSKR